MSTDIDMLQHIAFEEMKSGQYEEAAIHFNQVYTGDPNNYMAYFLRACCKSHCGIRGNVIPDAQKLTSAFELTCEKAIARRQEILLTDIMSLYEEKMRNLAYNAVEEVEYVSQVQICV